MYFEKPGLENTELTSTRDSKERALDLEIKHAAVATTTGETGVRAAEAPAGKHAQLEQPSTRKVFK